MANHEIERCQHQKDTRTGGVNECEISNECIEKKYQVNLEVLERSERVAICQTFTLTCDRARLRSAHLQCAMLSRGHILATVDVSTYHKQPRQYRIGDAWCLACFGG